MNTGKDSKWFPHDSDALDDPKIMLMVSQLGMEGYGLYWMIVECLLKQPGYMLPVKLIEAISRRFQVSKEKIETIILNYDLFEQKGDYFLSPSLIRRMQVYDTRNETNRSNALKRWNGQKNAIALPSHYDRNAIREDNIRKEKITKHKKRKEEISLSSLSFYSDSFIPIWKKWVEYKKEIGKPYKTLKGMQTKLDALTEMSENDPVRALKIVNQSIGEEWAGFFPLKNKDASNKNTGEDPVKKMIREATEVMNSSK